MKQGLQIALSADDTTLFLVNKLEMSHDLSIFNKFLCVSGLEMNKQKSEAMWLGCKKRCTK